VDSLLKIPPLEDTPPPAFLRALLSVW